MTGLPSPVPLIENMVTTTILYHRAAGFVPFSSYASQRSGEKEARRVSSPGNFYTAPLLGLSVYWITEASQRLFRRSLMSLRDTQGDENEAY
jgi:hypothetical protein